MVSKAFLRSLLRQVLPASRARREANRWLKGRCAEIKGRVLSIGSGDDSDGCGSSYRCYFPLASSYTTSEVTRAYGCDLVLDVRSMPEVASDSYDCLFCSGVLEHVDDLTGALNELTRILKPRGVLLLGLPFKQGLHLAPNDYWRFTEFGIRRLLQDRYDIIDLTAVDHSARDFPAAYWCQAVKRQTLG